MMPAPSLFDRPLPLTRLERAIRGRAYLAQVLRRNVCADCCDEEDLAFDREATLEHLVLQGVTTAVLARTVKRCAILCRRCWWTRASRRSPRRTRSNAFSAVSGGRSP